MNKFWRINISRRLVLSILLILVPQVSIFFILRTLLLDQILENALVNQSLILFNKGIYLASFAIFAFFGSFYLIKTKRKQFFILSFLYRVTAILSILFFKNGIITIVPCFLLGSSFGLGFPSDLSFLADNVEVDKRGRVSGLTLFTTFILVMMILMLSSSYNFSITQNTGVIFALQFTSIGVLFLYSSWNTPPRISISLRKIKENKKFVLYLLPWMMFSLANGANIFFSGMIEVSELSQFATLIQYLSSCIFCILAGIISDYYGRKPTLLIGFVILGVAYSLAPYMINPTIDILSSFFTGIAWSFIMVSFLFTIVGDLSPMGCREIYYAVSGIFWMVIETSLAFVSSVFTILLPVSIVSSILSVSMFLSVIPLLYSSETIPQNKLVDRRISAYFEKVLELLEVRND